MYPIAGMDPFLVQGCVPINPFGQTMSAAAHDYAFDPLEEFNTIDQQVFAGSVSGDLWKGWGAGPMLGAAGVEYRIEELDNLTSKTRPQAYRDDMSLTFGNDFAGETKVSEAFVEVELPLLADKPGGGLLEPQHRGAPHALRQHRDALLERRSQRSARRDVVESVDDLRSCGVGARAREPLARHSRGGFPRALLPAEHRVRRAERPRDQPVHARP